jgi:hypothetical protein
MLSRYSASAWPWPDRRQAGQHPLANGFGILAQFLTAQTWAAPETQNHWRRLDSELNHLDGRKRVGASVTSRLLPAWTQDSGDDGLAARYSIFRDTDAPKTACTQPASPFYCSHVGVAQGHACCASCISPEAPRVPSPHDLTTSKNGDGSPTTRLLCESKGIC